MAERRVSVNIDIVRIHFTCAKDTYESTEMMVFGRWKRKLAVTLLHKEGLVGSIGHDSNN